MFKIWSYLVLCVLLFLLFIIFTKLSSFFFFYIYSELFWIILFFLQLVISSYLNDPRFIILGLIGLLIASVEIIVIGFYLAIHENLSN